MASSFDKAVTIVNSLLVGDADWDGGASVSGIELSRNGIVVKLGSNKDIELKTSGTGAIKMEAFGSAVIYLNTLLEKDLDAGFTAASIIGALNELKGEVGGTPVTLAASATTGGLDLTVQEIGFQAASAGTPVSAAVTSLGDVDTEVRRLNTTTWAEDTWWTSGEYPKEIFRHDGGTTWTSFVNASDAGSAGYNWHVWHNGELWVGGNDATHKIWSFNPGTEVWTGRGGVGDVIAYTGIGVWDSTIVVGNLFDRVYKYVSGTTWTDLGKPGADRIRDLVDIGGVLFARNEFGVVYEYSGAGTSWASVSVPMVAEKITNWNGVLVAACKDAGKPVVYKYEASTWTKLGGDLNAGSTFFDFIAADSSGSLYAQPSGGTTVDIYKYDAGLDSWSSVGSYASASGKETYDGEFNPSDVAAFGVAEDEIKTFQDAYSTPINGYLTGVDWNTFNNKADANQTMYLGTTSVAINRASAALTLAGITLTTPNIGTPSAGVLTSCTGLPVAGLADGTDGELITWDASGVAATVAAGTATHVLTSNGPGAAPTFQAVAVGGDVSAAAVIADHSVVRGDGGAKGVQGSTLLISDTGQLSTGNEAAPDCSAGGITLQQGTDAALILSLKGSNVVHPFTTQAEADTFGGLRRWSATDGGINCQGFGANAVSGIILNSYTETPATANTGDGIGVLHVLTRKSNGGTSNQALASTDNAISLATDASSGVKVILKGSGDIYQVAGGHRLSSWVNTPVAGAIEWDGTNFRGYNGTSWVNLDN